MRSDRAAVIVSVGLAVAAAGAAIVSAQQGQAPTSFPLSNTIRGTGQGVTPAFEGWYYDRDGSIRLLIGYFNRNTKQELDIPIGANNRIEPGDADQGQPTHFLPGRQFGVFAIKVPKDFGTRQIVWTLVANGQTNVIPMHIKPDWVVEPFEDAGSKNTPPVVRFTPNGAPLAGPPAGIAATLTATAGVPLPLVTWATDDGPKVNVVPPQERPRPRAGANNAPAFTPPPPLALTWSVYRGTGAVTFANAKPSVDKADGKASTTATFAAPGDYILRLQANDQSGEGGGGFQCCWSNVHVAVAVRPAGTQDR
jgi:hypothetical protein